MGALRRSYPTAIRALCCVSVAACFAATLFVSRDWPLVGDASLMHYLVFLMQHGMVPYREIVDINLPGTYLFEWLGMAMFGKGALGWRLYDAFLMLAMLGACVELGRRLQSWFSGVLAGILLGLIHLQDGLFQVGQRDLLMAAVLLGAYLALFAAQTGKRPVLQLGLFGLAIGTTATIKPVLVPLGLVLLAMAAWRLRQRAFSVLAGLIGMVLPVAVATIWLDHLHALSAFLQMTRGLLVLHSGLGKQSFAFLLGHCISPIGLIALAWLVLVCWDRPALSPFRAQLYVGLIGTAFAYFAQGKGYPYQRYPLLALLLMVICLDLDRLMSVKACLGYASLVVCAVLSLGMAPRYAWTAAHFSPVAPFQDALAVKLDALGRDGGLSGKVQCLDTFGGCVGVLYERGIVQSTGYVYDCYLYGPPSAVRDSYRAGFLAAFRARPPQFVVETDQFCFGTRDGFAKLDQWPEFEQELGRGYSLESAWRSPTLQHWWSRRDEPVQFRTYVRR